MAKRVRRTRLAFNRDEHAAARREHVEDASVMGLEANASHRARETEFRQVTGIALQGRGRATRATSGAYAGQVEPSAGAPSAVR